MAITIYDLKPRFQRLLRPLVRRVAAAGVTANQVALVAMGVNAIAGRESIERSPSIAVTSLPGASPISRTRSRGL